MGKPAISDYIPVSVSTLLPSESAGINLYQREAERIGRPGHVSFVLYCAEGQPIEQQDLDRLHQRGVHRLFIQSASRETFQSYLRDLIDPESSGPEPSLAARMGALNEVVRDVLETEFREGDTDQTVSEAERLGSVTADIVCHDEFAAVDMFRVLHHDYATFTHSANVAFYAGLLADKLGYERDDVQLMTTAGLLHDLGKLDIDEKILCKPGRLNEEEFDLIKSHPTIGFEQLNYREDLTEGQLMMVYQHHERLDGGGYPVGVVESEIHPWAKICSVVDVYEAMTSYRPYRAPMPRTTVFQIMERDSGKSFDPEVLACWLQITNAVWGS
jgi:putative nucleotidyltransferase with HDIG domain